MGLNNTSTGSHPGLLSPRPPSVGQSGVPSSKVSSFSRESAPIAAGWVRVLSFFIDNFVMSILIGFISSPWSRGLTEAMALGNKLAVITSIIHLFLITSAIAYLYGVIPVAVWNATPGMMVFGLKIVNSYTGQKIGWKTAIRRTNVFWFANIAMGFGLIGAFTDKFRRTWHDLHAETIVIRPHHRAHYPGLFEKAVGNAAVYGVVILFMGLVYEVTIKQNTPGFENAFLKELEKSEGLSEGLSEVKNERHIASESKLLDGCKGTDKKNPVPQGKSEIAQRLEDHQLRGYPLTCLEAVAERALVTNNKDEQAYFAKAVTSTDQKHESDYFKKICEVSPQSRTCNLVKVVEFHDQGKYAEAAGLVLPLMQVNDFVSLWAYDYLIAEFKFNETLEHFNKYNVEKSEFRQFNTLRSYMGVGREAEARAGFESWLSVNSGKPLLYLPAINICSIDVAGECSTSESLGCKKLAKILDGSKLKDYEGYFLGRHALCQNKTEEAEKLFSTVVSADLINAEKLGVQNKHFEAIELYKKVIAAKDSSKEIKGIAQLRVAWLNSDKLKNHAEALSAFKLADRHIMPLVWLTVGRQIQKIEMNEKLYGQATEFAQFMLSINPQDEILKQQLSIAQTALIPVRAPASVKRLPQQRKRK
ncbi:MAG: RDD family protein [Oligoflexia bacterium]|nr:RDD family protein [Oligoflexia bacterium]